MDEHKHKKTSYFKKELSSDDITRAAHYTYRDGFRLGFGIFVGFLAGSLVLVLVVYLLNLVFKAL